MISLSAGGAEAEIVPERGAICTRLRLGGSDLLYLDPATLEDPAKNVRGGIPILFPIAGKPVPPLRQHGFARNLAWETIESHVCRLRSTEATRALFPHDFELTAAFKLSASSLRIDFALRNTGLLPMPLHFGLHPYFRATDKRAAWIETDATLSLDNRSGTEGVQTRLDFDVDELDVALLDHDDDGTVLHRGEGPAIQLRWSPRFRTLVLWTLRGRDFICVEPWTAPGLALATGEGLLQLLPGEAATPWLEISI